jgi:hypothetical protein
MIRAVSQEKLATFVPPNAAKIRLGGSKRPYREQTVNIEPFAEYK